jgi:2-iminobutanoate/2-iminopropanoate deaminase
VIGTAAFAFATCFRTGGGCAGFDLDDLVARFGSGFFGGGSTVAPRCLWMPYAPAIKVRGGTTVYLAGCTAAPVYHHHPHRPEEFDSMPRDMEGQARAALTYLKRGLEAVGASFADVVTCDRFVTDLSDQDALNHVWAEFFGGGKPATTTVQVVRLPTDPRCLVEINVVAVID